MPSLPPPAALSATRARTRAGGARAPQRRRRAAVWSAARSRRPQPQRDPPSRSSMPQSWRPAQWRHEAHQEASAPSGTCDQSSGCCASLGRPFRRVSPLRQRPHLSSVRLVTAICTVAATSAAAYSFCWRRGAPHETALRMVEAACIKKTQGADGNGHSSIDCLRDHDLYCSLRCCGGAKPQQIRRGASKLIWL